MHHRALRLAGVLAFLGIATLAGLLAASDPPPPQISTLTVTNTKKIVTWPPYPAAQEYKVQAVRDLGTPYITDPSGVVSGYTFTSTNGSPSHFYRLAVTPLSSNALLTANILNRLAYGPTPDEIERVLTAPGAITPEGFIDEQLAPEAIAETSDTVVTITTNSAAAAATTNWSSISVTGSVSSSLLYMYLTGTGDVYVDDVQLRLQSTGFTTNTTTTYTTNGAIITTNVVTTITTNVTLSANMLVNGDFESSLFGTGTNGWKVSPNLLGSSISSSVVCSGLGSLHMVSSAAGSTGTNAIWQQILPQASTANSNKWVLSFRYLPNAYSAKLVMRVSGSGTRVNAYGPPPSPTWVYATATGTATTTPTLYIYLGGAGTAYLDDLKLVLGTVAESGPNLLQNGDFESALSGPWQLTANFSNSVISSSIAHSGASSLKIVATAGGSGSGNAIFQTPIAGVTNTGTYTVSFWYVPSSQPLTVRLSGSLLLDSPDTTVAGIKRRLDSIGGVNIDTGGATVDSFGGAKLNDLRIWFCMNAVGSKRQLLEILDQFLENHFVTEHAKSSDYFDGFYDGGIIDTLATDWEYREHAKWRAALLNPNTTFYDLLKISAESPAMIVYLDTVGSTGDGIHIANENYSREILELFCLGVDNGYEQHDIEAQSRAWTGWSVDIVDRANINNPFAPQSTSYGFYPGVGNGTSISNIIGAWAFNYKAANHGTNRAPIFSVWDTNSTSTNLIPLGPKIVPARFGPPWAGQPYQLVIPRRITGDTNSIQDGYDVIRHLANLPFTEEYISVKLCRLFVHDNFPNPTTKSDEPEYAFYDYTDPSHSAEAELVHQCMLAWEHSSPKGNLRAVLATIFASDLFRSHGGSMQKVKTPLEFVISAVRALRANNGNGTFTAFTDGNFSSQLSRMGSMNLFNRDAPDGYPEAGPPWISAGTLAERLRFIQTLLTASGSRTNLNGTSNTDASNHTVDPVSLLKKKLPAASWSDTGAVADYFLSILYPAEGKANLDLYHGTAVKFLNTDDGGVTSSPFSGLSSTSATYDTRVRAMVSWLMTLQRFQEQ